MQSRHLISNTTYVPGWALLFPYPKILRSLIGKFLSIFVVSIVPTGCLAPKKHYMTSCKSYSMCWFNLLHVRDNLQYYWNTCIKADGWLLIGTSVFPRLLEYRHRFIFCSSKAKPTVSYASTIILHKGTIYFPRNTSLHSKRQISLNYGTGHP